MVVITLSKCPPSLRGDLTKWLFEVSTGVYVGNINARVRVELWKRVGKNLKNGTATMVWNTNNEQGLDFCVINNDWEPINFDGIKLMMHPNLQRQKQTQTYKTQSNASNFAMARHQNKKEIQKSKTSYVVIDIETTGLLPEKSQIIEIAALRIVQGNIVDQFETLILPEVDIPEYIEKLTGISKNLLLEKGIQLKKVLEQFLNFIGDTLIVSHNIAFDKQFINFFCEKNSLPLLENETKDTLKLSKELLYNIRRHRLIDVATHYGIDTTGQHRAMTDCHITYQVYEKLAQHKPNENDQ